jgi:hypothetical protein
MCSELAANSSNDDACHIDSYMLLQFESLIDRLNADEVQQIVDVDTYTI